MDMFFSPKQEKTDDAKLSSGVFMTVWQSVPQRPEVAMLMRQQEEIAQLKLKNEQIEMRLNLLEEKLAKIERSFKLFTAKVNRLLKKLSASKNVSE